MTSGQKVAFSLLISVLAFCAFTVVAFSGLFDLLEVNFYQPIVQEIKQKKLGEIAAAQNEYFQTLMKRFDNFTVEPDVKTYVSAHPDDEAVKKRENLRSNLVVATSGLKGMRIIDNNGRNVYFSTFPSDVIKGKKGISYRNYNSQSNIPFDVVKARDGVQITADSDKKARIIKVENEKQLIFSLPFYNTENDACASILFYCDASNFSHFLFNRNLIDITGFAELVTYSEGYGGFVFGLPNYGRLSIKKQILENWRKNDGESFWKLVPEKKEGEETEIEKVSELDVFLGRGKSSTLCAFTYRPEREDFGFITFLYNEDELKIPPYMRILLLATAFVTLYLAIFLILSLKHDDIVIIRDKVRRYENEFFISYKKTGSTKDLTELPSQKDALERRILKSLGKRGEKHASEFKSIFESYWQEMSAYFGMQNVPVLMKPSSPVINTEDLKEIVRSSLEDILENGKIQINASMGSPESLAGKGYQNPEKTPAQNVLMPSVEEQELAVEEAKLVEASEVSLASFDLHDDFSEIEALIEKSEKEETAKELSVLDDDEDDDFAELQNKAESEETEVLDEAEPLEEVESFDDAEELDEAEEITEAEDAEELDEAEPLEEVESFDDAEELDEAEEITEAEDAEELDEAEPLEEVESFDDAEELDEAEEITEAEDAEELDEAEPLEEAESFEVEEKLDEPEEIAESENAEEINSSENSEILKRIADFLSEADEEEEDFFDAEGLELFGFDEINDIEQFFKEKPEEAEEPDEVEEIPEAEEAGETEEADVEEIEPVEEIEEAEDSVKNDSLEDAEEVEELEELDGNLSEADVSGELEKISNLSAELKLERGSQIMDSDSPEPEFTPVLPFDSFKKLDDELEMLPEVSDMEAKADDIAKTLAALPEKPPRWTEKNDLDLDSEGLIREFSDSEKHDIRKLKDVRDAVAEMDTKLEELESFDFEESEDVNGGLFSPDLAAGEHSLDDDVYKDEVLLEKIEFGVPSSQVLCDTSNDSMSENFSVESLNFGELDEEDADEKAMYEDTPQRNIKDSEHFYENKKILAKMKENAKEISSNADNQNTASDENIESINDTLDDIDDVEAVEELEENMPFTFTQIGSTNSKVSDLLSDTQDAIVQDNDGTFHVTKMPQLNSKLALNMEFKKLVDSILR